MSNENNKFQIDIENLFKQNVNDLSAIKELYRKLKEVEEKILQIKYIDSTLANKLKKDYEKLKKIILDENVQAKLTNEIETINTQLTNDIETINSQLYNKASQSDLEVERKRIDRFARLEEGSTTGDAELIDARIGADGIIYNSLGTGVRKQIKKLDNVFSKSNIYKETELIDDLKDTRERGYLNQGTLVSSTGYNTNFYDVSEGDKIIVNGVYVKNLKFYVVEFLDSNNLYVSEHNNGNEFTGEVIDFNITVPERATKMAVTTVIGTYNEKKFNKDSIEVILTNNIEDIDEIKNNVDKIKNNVDELQNKFNWISSNHWYDKKIVWLGTSVSFGANSTKSYAQEAANKLGFNLVNTSVPGLAIHTDAYGNKLINGSTCLSKAEYLKQGVTIADSPIPYIPGGSYNNYYTTYENIFTQENADADLWVFDVIPNNTNFDTTDYDNFDRNKWCYKDGKSFEEHRTTFLGAFIFLLDKLYKLNPKARVVMLAGSNFSRSNGKNAFETLRDGALHYPFIDIWGKVNYNCKTQSYLYSKDGTDMHPSTKAHEILGNILTQELLQYS